MIANSVWGSDSIGVHAGWDHEIDSEETMNSRAASDSFPRTFFAPRCARFVRNLNHRSSRSFQAYTCDSKNLPGLSPPEPKALVESVHDVDQRHRLDDPVLTCGRLIPSAGTR